MIDLSKPDIGKKEIKSVIKVLKSGNLVDGYFQSKSENLIKKIEVTKHSQVAELVDARELVQKLYQMY